MGLGDQGFKNAEASGRRDGFGGERSPFLAD
jgi:hypothetical protein